MKKRVISAAVLIAVTFAAVMLSEYSRVLLFAVCGGLCAYEYRARMKDMGIHVTGWVMFSFLAIQAFLTITHSGLMAYLAWFTAGIFISLFSGVLHSDVSGQGALYTLAGLCYPCMPYALMMIISVSHRWQYTLLLSFFPVILCDTFALLGGKKFGKRKVAPHVSPNKTIEGCVCGAVAGTVSGLVIYLIFGNSYLTLIRCLLTAFVSSSLGQIGDLAESLIKRYIGVKDFSNLIPGHGGMFDRTDSLMFGIPAAYFCLYVLGL